MSVSIITASLNNLPNLKLLAKSLISQHDQDFYWIVYAGGSVDGTVEYVNSLNKNNFRVINDSDFGIYDAINKSLVFCKTEYYVVAGADDLFEPMATKIFNEISNCQSHDIFTFNVKYCNKIVVPSKLYPFLAGQFSYISMHSVGTLIRKSLHDKFGYYNKLFPIAADQLFILSSIKNGASVKYIPQNVGNHGSLGVSYLDSLGVITEFFRVQVSVGFNKRLQTIFVILRLFKSLFRK